MANPTSEKRREIFDESKDSQRKLLWWILTVASALVVGLASSEILLFQVTDLFILGAAMFVAVMLRASEVKIPTTDITFSPNLILIFWAITAFGFKGGAAIAAFSAILTLDFHSTKIRQRLLQAARETIAAASAGFVFELVKGFVSTGSSATPIESQLLLPNPAIYSLAALVVTNFAVGAALITAILRLKLASSYAPRLRRMIIKSSISHVIAFFATVLILISFDQYGPTFGVVWIALSVIFNIGLKLNEESVEQQTRQTAETSRIHLATVEALATAIDARDQVGHGHVQRTQIYAVGLGRTLGLSDDDLKALHTGALLHDVGKLAVPDHILNKPGRLTAAETEKSKIHTSVGASILGTVAFPYPVVPTVLHHHEAWNGSGYPDGLRGTEIPITARILTIVDVFDSLRGARPYRPAISREDACNFLRSRAGSQFDPNLVNLFLRNLSSYEREIELAGLSYSNTLERSEKVFESVTESSAVEQIMRANREVVALYEIAREFSSSMTLEETLQLFTQKVQRLVPHDTCVVYLLDESANNATAVHVSGLHKDLLVGMKVRVGEGATGYVLKKCTSVENVDPSLDFGFAFPEICQEYLAMASLPLVANEKIIGAVSLFSCSLPIYQDEHLRVFETVSRIAADAIAKSLHLAETQNFALTDQMTGMPNGRSLQIQFDKEVARARRSGLTLQLLVLDLDGFKAVNDNFGHIAGDQMLKAVASVISRELRDYDFLARYGGDEFIALVPETDSADVLELSRRIEQAVTNLSLCVAENSFAKVGVSIGSSNYPEHGETFDKLIEVADRSMYRTKAFHKQRNARLTSRSEKPTSGKSYETDDGIVIEIDESQVVSYDQIN